MMVDELSHFIERTERKALTIIITDLMESRINTREAFKKTVQLRNQTDRMRMRLDALARKDKQ
jgi:hypothetical protein